MLSFSLSVTPKVYKKFVICLFSDAINRKLRTFITSSMKNQLFTSSDHNVNYINNRNEDVLSDENILSDESPPVVESPENSKILKVAVVGTPNVGKSTLINQIVGRQIFAISRKVHTTRCRARAVHVEGRTQLIFLDTPGLVTGRESSKHNLEKSFLVDGESAIQEADIVGVVHDVSSDRYQDRLDPKVLHLLHFYPSKHTFLILNKIDCLKSKRVLLDLAEILTCRKLKDSKHTKLIKEEVKEWEPKTEFSIDKVIKKQKGWPKFKEIFMVSALDGSGIGDIKEYLLQHAKPGDWLFSKNVFTDQSYIKMIEETVQAKLLDNLPNEVPYNLTTQLEFYDKGRAGAITAVVLVGCKTPRIQKLVMGPGGKRIRAIAESAENDLRNLFRAPVRLRVVVTKQKPRTVDIDELTKSGSLELLENS